MRMGKPYDLVFTTKIVAVLTFLFTGRKKSVFLYTFVFKMCAFVWVNIIRCLLYFYKSIENWFMVCYDWLFALYCILGSLICCRRQERSGLIWQFWGIIAIPKTVRFMYGYKFIPYHYILDMIRLSLKYISTYAFLR